MFKIKQAAIALAMTLVVSGSAFALGAEATATNTTNALSGSSATSGSSSGVTSAIHSGSVGVGNNAGNLSNQQTALGGQSSQGQMQGQGQHQSQGNQGFNNGQSQGVQLGGNGWTDANGVFHAGSPAFSVDSHAVSQAADLSKAVGNAFAPALTTTLTETCMGSTSFGGGFSGGSFSFGTTWRDHACVRRLDAREIRSYGDIQAAKEIMCDSDLVREAFKRVGRPCAEDGGTYVAVAEPVPAPAPAVEPEKVIPQPATDKPVKDDQDEKARHDAEVLRKADEASKVMHEKYDVPASNGL